MENNVTYLIDVLDEQAMLFRGSGAPEHEQEALRLQMTANCLRKYRETLIRIANNQGGMSSHQAKETLTQCGDCAHLNLDYVYSTDDDQRGWTCADCGKRSESDKVLMPFA